MRDQLLKKRAVHFDRGVFAKVICLVLIFTPKAEFRIWLYQLMVTVYHSDSIKIILRPGSCIDLWQIKRVQKNIYISGYF